MRCQTNFSLELVFNVKNQSVNQSPQKLGHFYYGGHGGYPGEAGVGGGGEVLWARVRVRHFIIPVHQHCNHAVALRPLVRCWCQQALERTCDRCPCLASSLRLHHPPLSRLQFISRRAPSPKTSLNHPAHVKWCRACLSLTSKCPSEIYVSSRAVVLSVNTEF